MFVDSLLSTIGQHHWTQHFFELKPNLLVWEGFELVHLCTAGNHVEVNWVSNVCLLGQH